MRRTLMGAAAAGALLVSLSACGDSVAPAGTGTLSIMLTDAPFPFDQVARADMYVVRIEAKMAESSEAEAEHVDGDAAHSSLHEVGESGEAVGDPRREWVTIATPNQSYNLLDLRNGVVTNLGQITLPTGTYRSFRLILDTQQSSITLQDGTVLTGSSTPGIVWPSAGQSGIKIKLVQPVSIGAVGTAMLLDFDLGGSFVLRGKTIRDGLLFKPVIRATAHTVDAAPATGALAGTLTCGSEDGPSTPVASGTVELLKVGADISDATPENVVATTGTDAQGGFQLDNLPPGDYTLRATRPEGTASCATSTLAPGVVVSGGTTGNVQLVLPAI
jgi:hypothetical protein